MRLCRRSQCAGQKMRLAPLLLARVAARAPTAASELAMVGTRHRFLEARLVDMAGMSVYNPDASALKKVCSLYDAGQHRIAW